MRLSTHRRCVGKIAASLGLLQGAAWAIMALAAIILYNWSPAVEEPTTYRKLVEVAIYNHFIRGTSDYSQSVPFIIRPKDFTILMWIYFVLSVGWVALSIDLFAALHLDKQRQTSMLITWGSVTFIVSLLDLIFACFLGRDYSVCDEIVTDATAEGSVINAYYCYLSVGVIMSVVARGYTLWVINVVLAFGVIYVAVNVINDNKGFGSLYSYQAHSIPRIKIPKSDTTDSISRVDNNDYQSTNSNLYSMMPVRLPVFQTSGSSSKVHGSQEDAEVPSFLSRGEKFSY